jgi:hypothetical protein
MELYSSTDLISSSAGRFDDMRRWSYIALVGIFSCFIHCISAQPHSIPSSLDSQPLLLPKQLLNDNCLNAIPVDPLSDAVIIGNNTLARRITDGNPVQLPSPALWYKVSNATWEFIVSTCNSQTTFDTTISIY